MDSALSAICSVTVGFVAGLLVCGVHWMHRVRQELETADPSAAKVLKRLLRWPA